MSAILFLAAIGSFLIGLFGLANIRSDIQIIIALSGILGGFVLIGLGSALHKLNKLALPRG